MAKAVAVALDLSDPLRSKRRQRVRAL